MLAQLLWVRGKSNASADVKRQYMIFERPLELSEFDSFGQHNLDLRKLKASFPEASFFNEFRSYGDRFCRLLGVESEMALRLLHKTQSAKNLGDLNTFLRDFMLDKPKTFAVTERLINEFAELNSAHQAVVAARQQVETLSPARDQYQKMQQMSVREFSTARIGEWCERV